MKTILLRKLGSLVLSGSDEISVVNPIILHL